VDQDMGMASSVKGAGMSQPSDHPMYQLLEQEGGRIVPERGETIEGIIMGISPSEVIVDIACKSEGIVTSRDLERLDPDFRKTLKVGDQVLVYVLRPEDAEGNIILSLSRAQMEGDWQRATELFEAGEVVEEAISGCNRGGVIAHIGRVRGFVPASQLVSVRIPRNLDDDAREEMLSQIVGQKLALKIIELDRRRNRLILSERAAQREWRQDQKERLLDELADGETRRGVVSSLCNFGAFVDLGGADGLVHLSELAWRRVEHPSEVLRVGQEVSVQVIGVDRDRRRIALSIKRLQPEPWSTVEERYQIGQLVTGKITKITDFGAFAQIDEHIEGLIHISEISEDRIAHPKDVLQEGQEQTVRIIRIDADRQRMGLSLRRVDDSEYFDDSEWQDED
jgi:small subunit ribosomal protein S1